MICKRGREFPYVGIAFRIYDFQNQRTERCRVAIEEQRDLLFLAGHRSVERQKVAALVLGAFCIQIKLIDRNAGLVLELQTKLNHSARFRCRFGGLSGFLILFGCGYRDLRKLCLCRFDRCRIGFDLYIRRIPLVRDQALCKRFRKVRDRVLLIVVILRSNTEQCIFRIG